MRRDGDIAPHAVGARVDWLEVTFRVDLDPGKLSLLKRRGAEAVKLDAATCVELHGVPFKLTPPARTGKWLLTGDTIRAAVLEHAPGADPDGSPGWGVTVTCSGTSLLARGYEGAIADAWAVAGALGDVVEARFGRTDLACDVAGYRLREEDRHSFIKQRRVKVSPMGHDGTAVQKRGKVLRETSGDESKPLGHVVWKLDGRRVVAFLKDPENGALAEFYSGGTFSGFAFGSRTSVSARVYDKRHELRAQSPEKREAEEAWWRGNGWDGKSDVARVEFELRGEALDELRLRHPVRGDAGPEAHAVAFRDGLDGAWAYCSRKWLRLVRRGSPDVVQPRWRVAQEAVFHVAAAPRVRIRQRGAAKAAQAEGSMFSLLGAVGALPEQLWLPHINPRTGEVDDMRWNTDESVLVDEYCARALDGDEHGAAERAAVRCLGDVGKRAAWAVWSYERERAGGDVKRALARVWAKQRATLARFAQSAAVVPAAIAA